MSAFERFWTSYPARVMVHTIARLFPTWFYEVTWQWGEQEAVVRRELLLKAQRCANARILKQIVQATHELVLTLFNEHYGGTTLEEQIPPQSVRNFPQLYTTIMALLCFRLRKQIDGLYEDLAAICREPRLIESIWNILAGQPEDEGAQARRVWDECLQILNGDSTSKLGFFCGFFVIMVNRTSERLRETVG